MSRPVALILFSLRRVRALVLTIGLVLAGFEILLAEYARSIHASGGFNQLASMFPPFMRELMGSAMIAFMSFAGIVCFGYFHPLVIAALIALSISVATTPVSEIETGWMDLVLARPVARHWIVTRTILVLVACVCAALLFMTGATWVSMQTIAPAGAKGPSPALIRSLALNLGCLMVAWGGVALAIGSVSKRRGAAGAIAGVAALTTFFLDYIGRLWKPLMPLAKLSPFHYFNPVELVTGAPLPLKHVVVLTGIALAGFATAYAMFSRRDISH